MKESTKGVAMGGVMIALSMITLFLATFMPGIELTLYAIASFYTAFIILESGIKAGWIFYLASAILSILLIPNKVGLLPFVMFFGLYGIIKYYIEKLKKQPIEIILKLLFFNIILASGIFFFKEAFLGNIKIPDFSRPLIIGGAQIIFLFYDYLFTMGIGFYLRRKPKSW
ncbi:hypothetical protein [Anaerovorax odorimutans]|uniref:hypothetical protein n=1 Tax=Anaerovorax odorimutans TaxID=109327 RepID=UPI00040ED0B5|nr:hypothetical protein [Anaerovorax odorimutans]